MASLEHFQCQYCHVRWTLDDDGMLRFACPDCRGNRLTYYEQPVGFEQSKQYTSSRACTKCFGQGRLERPYFPEFSPVCPSCLLRQK